MGELVRFYQIADIAIVGGSFVKGIGGHNILEPMAYGVPTLFGPHMEAQKDMVERAIRSDGARCIQLDELSCIFEDLSQMGARGKDLVMLLRGGSEKTLKLIDLPLS